ncbi:hypothetical protein NQ318_015909 [Aromia moschata]|uniref:THAP-type domain-containing protein n=1 Tax=Aromia moschata TaxID=1265417 RepID=A0AAV8Y6E7_9CUCU|nr:hypothetical protein NQ318_015909 [Aromia moschata]
MCFTKGGTPLASTGNFVFVYIFPHIAIINMAKLECAVPTCKSQFKVKSRQKVAGQTYVSFHKLPVNRQHAKQWVQKCRIPNPSPDDKICSLHFRGSDFVVKPNSIRRRLRSKAMPSLNLPSRSKPPKYTLDSTEETSNCEDEGEDQMTYENLNQKFLKLSKEHADLSEQNRKKSDTIVKQAMRLKYLEERLLQLATKNGVSEKKISFDSDLEAVKRELEVRNSEFRRLSNNLSNLLSKTQLEILTRQKTRVRWSSEDMARAFPIYYFSKKCYLYLKYNLKFPLPSVEILEQWAESNEVVLRIPAYEIFQGLKNCEDESCE